MEHAIQKLGEVSKQCSQVKKDIESLATTNSAISNTSKEQSIGVDQVNQAILSVNQNADIINQNAKELAHISKEIVSNTGELTSSSKNLSLIAYGRENGSKLDLTKNKYAGKKNVIPIRDHKVRAEVVEEIPEVSSSEQKLVVNSGKDGWENI